MRKFKTLIFIFGLLALAGLAQAKHIHPEKYYQNKFAQGLKNAKTEVVAPDGTRCDILTPTHAVEADFAPKWGEAIGQALNYAMQFDKRAGILLILEEDGDYRHYIRVNSIVKHFKLPVDVYTISPPDGEKERKALTVRRGIGR